MERKEFLRSVCNLCLLGTAGVLTTRLAACSPSLPVYKTPIRDGKLELPLSLFTNSTVQLVRPQGWHYDIAVRKTGQESYSAILLKCTHQDNQLYSTGQGYQCSLHGSQFSMDGQVRKGPAEHSLQSFPTSVRNGQILITI